MIAHQPIGAPVADSLVERRGSRKIGEHQGDVVDGDVLPGAQRLARQEVAEGLQQGGAMGGQRIRHPGTALDDDAGVGIAAIAELNFARRRCRAGRDRNAIDGDGGKALVGAMVDIDLTAGLDGAQTVGTGGKRCGDFALLARREDLLDDDMRRRIRAVEAVFADRQLAHARRRPEAELDVAGEVGIVADIAGGAMRRLRQLVERGDRALGAAAARTEQIPAQPQEADPRRLEEELDDEARLGRPVARQLERPHAHQIDFRRGQEMLAEPRRQTMPIGAGFDLRHCCGDAPAGALRQRRRGIVEEPHSFAGEILCRHLDQPADRGATLLEKTETEEDCAGQPLRLAGQRIAEQRPRALRPQLDDGPEAPQRPFAEYPGLAEAVAAHPLVGSLLPLQLDPADRGPRQAEHPPIRLQNVLDLVFRHPRRFVEARGIGDHRPQRLGRLRQMPLPAPAMKSLHVTRLWKR